jgi:hypothetical protein
MGGQLPTESVGVSTSAGDLAIAFMWLAVVCLLQLVLLTSGRLVLNLHPHARYYLAAAAAAALAGIGITLYDIRHTARAGSVAEYVLGAVVDADKHTFGLIEYANRLVSSAAASLPTFSEALYFVRKPDRSGHYEINLGPSYHAGISPPDHRPPDGCAGRRSSHLVQRCKQDVHLSALLPSHHEAESHLSPGVI